MILTCPSCATGYFVPDDTIGAEGRKVRCKACAHVWRAERAEEPLDLSTLPDAAPNIEHALTGAAPETLAETPAPELPRAFRARAEQTRRLRRAATHGAIWAGLASVFAGILASAWLFRVEVVELWPRAAAAYAAVGSPVNVVGLQFEAVGARPLRNDPGKVVVSGALRNVRDKEVVAPSVRVALLDAHGAEIDHRVLPIRAAPVLPGKVQGFAVVIPDPGARAAGVDVQFVKAEARKPAQDDSAHQAAGHNASHAAPQADQVAAHDEPLAAVPVAAEDTGLRPAIGDLGAPAATGVVDAYPVTTPAPTRAAPAETATSAGHH